MIVQLKYKSLLIGCSLLITALYSIISISLSKAYSFDASRLVLVTFLGMCLTGFFIWALIRLNHKGIQDKIEAEIMQVKHDYQDQMCAFMHQQHNDILNAISIVIAYMQLDKYDDALDYLEFVAADQSDRYRHNFLADDLWQIVLNNHQELAQAKGIDFSINMEIDPPVDFKERQLIARLMANLLDRAFESVAGSQKPQVRLHWYQQQTKLVLDVNTQDKVISKRSQDDDCNLHICRQIAMEVGGRLVILRTPEYTTYRFSLKQVSHDAGSTVNKVQTSAGKLW